MNILNIENVTKVYGDKVLFDKVCLGINEGDKIGIIGVNGCGKSTFLKIISNNSYYFYSIFVSGLQAFSEDFHVRHYQAVFRDKRLPRSVPCVLFHTF